MPRMSRSVHATREVRHDRARDRDFPCRPRCRRGACVGPSGHGAYHGKAGFDTFSRAKSVLRKPRRPDPKLLYPPCTGIAERLLRRVLR
jgi:hypothetical protein